MTIVAFCNPLLDIAVQIKDNVLLEKYKKILNQAIGLIGFIVCIVFVILLKIPIKSQ